MPRTASLQMLMHTRASTANAPQFGPPRRHLIRDGLASFSQCRSLTLRLTTQDRRRASPAFCTGSGDAPISVTLVNARD